MVLVFSFLLAVALGYAIHVFSFWQRKGFPTDPPIIPFGCLLSFFRRQRSIGMAIYDVYKKSTAKVIGIYLLYRPAILIRDPKLARQILKEEFSSFHDRWVYVNEKRDPFSGNLFAVKGESWEALRAKLTPLFSTGRLRSMFGTINRVGDNMLEYLENVIPKNDEVVVEMKEVFEKYFVDIIGSVIFGLEVDSFNDPQNEFRSMATEYNKSGTIRHMAQFLGPKIEKFIDLISWHQRPIRALKNLVRQTVDSRVRNNDVRKDIMQMLIQLRNTGVISEKNNMWDTQPSIGSYIDHFIFISIEDGSKSMSVESIAGQVAFFYEVGFDTSASAATFTIFELAKSPQLLAKARGDVIQALDKHGGRITNDSIQDMKYLDLCMMETMRKYPGLPIINRECTKDFTIPGYELVIKKGTPIIISLFGIQRDPKYFHDPMTYDPERFLETNKNCNPIAYMPFGEGPRHCIGQELGKIMVKVALAEIIKRFDMETMQKGEIELEPFAERIKPRGGVKLRLTKRTSIST